MDTMIAKDTVIERNKQILTTTIEDRLVMMNIEKGNYLGMNAMGKKIWEMIEKPRTVESLCSDLLKQYDIDLEPCFTKVTCFLEQLDKAGLIETKDTLSV